MVTQVFIGRNEELERLAIQHKKKTPSLAVIKGRRRVGKSRLIHYFASKHEKSRLWDFAGLAPQEGMNDQNQRDHFAKQLASLLKTPLFTFQDWTDAFEHLGSHLRVGDMVLLDEISWMGSKDPSFIPKLKAWWDKQATPVMLVFCG
jgi:uncharacterized protein